MKSLRMHFDYFKQTKIPKYVQVKTGISLRANGSYLFALQYHGSRNHPASMHTLKLSVPFNSENSDRIFSPFSTETKSITKSCLTWRKKLRASLIQFSRVATPLCIAARPDLHDLGRSLTAGWLIAPKREWLMPGQMREFQGGKGPASPARKEQI